MIATVRDTEAHDTLVTMRAKTAAFDTLADAVDALAAHQAEAVVFDAPLLAHEISLRESSDVVLTGPLFDLQDYGIAVAEGSGLREKLNRELLHAVEDGQVRRLQEKWFGEYQ